MSSYILLLLPFPLPNSLYYCCCCCCRHHSLKHMIHMKHMYTHLHMHTYVIICLHRCTLTHVAPSEGHDQPNPPRPNLRYYSQTFARPSPVYPDLPSQDTAHFLHASQTIRVQGSRFGADESSLVCSDEFINAIGFFLVGARVSFIWLCVKTPVPRKSKDMHFCIIFCIYVRISHSNDSNISINHFCWKFVWSLNSSYFVGRFKFYELDMCSLALAELNISSYRMRIASGFRFRMVSLFQPFR